MMNHVGDDVSIGWSLNQPEKHDDMESGRGSKVSVPTP
jgi:hypothetical protein